MLTEQVGVQVELGGEKVAGEITVDFPELEAALFNGAAGEFKAYTASGRWEPFTMTAAQMKASFLRALRRDAQAWARQAAKSEEAGEKSTSRTRKREDAKVF